MNLSRIYNRNQEQKNKTNDSHIIDSLQNMFKQINWIVRDTIDNINEVYKKYQLRYSVNQHLDILLKILTPLQIKGYIDKRQAYLLFQNKNDAYNLFSELKGQYSHTYPTQPRQIQYKKTFRNPLTKPNDNTIRPRYTEPIQQKEQYYKSEAQPNPNNPNLNINTQLLRNKLRGEIQQKFRYNNMSNSEEVLKYRHNIKERKPGVRSRGLQDSLCTWIREESKRRPVGRLDVINRAKQLGKNNNLKGSVGWYSNFIRRNPEIRQILSKGNLIKKQGQSKHYPDQQNKMDQQSQISRLMGIYDQQGQNEQEDDNIKNEQSHNDSMNYSDYQSNSEFNPVNPHINPQTIINVDANKAGSFVSLSKSDSQQRKASDTPQIHQNKPKQK